MKTAIAAVRDGMKVRTGARAYAIPKDALHRRIKGKLKFPVEEQHQNILSLNWGCKRLCLCFLFFYI